jgi:pancreatic lipase-related protein 2
VGFSFSNYFSSFFTFVPEDPAYPAFQDAEKTNQSLDSSDAEFVDVIHTCSGMLGHSKKLGHADFFPNNGKASQPGCDFQSDFVGACSHGRSYRYFAESINIRNGFLAFECGSWEDFNSKMCEGDPIPMGDATPPTSKGTFFLETTNGPRFSRLIRINKKK